MMKVSVIVPIYKVEHVLKRCIDSIIAQTYQDIEIILVDDGSPDKCGSICDDYARKDNRIRVVHKENGGLSDARNAGLEIATGEWISFIDSDDWIEPDMYETLLENAEVYEAQISVGGVNDEIQEKNGVRIIKTTFHGEEVTETLSSVDAMRRHLLGSWAAWDKIYRKELFDRIRFPVGEINEDEAIMLLLLNQCNKIVYTNKVYYHYVRRSGSITATSFTYHKLAWLKHCEDNIMWVEKFVPEVRNEALLRLLKSYLWAMREMALADKRFENEILYVKNGIKTHYKSFKRLNLSTQEKIRLVLNRYFPYLIYRTMEKMMAHNNAKKDVEGGYD